MSPSYLSRWVDRIRKQQQEGVGRSASVQAAEGVFARQETLAYDFSSPDLPPVEGRIFYVEVISEYVPGPPEQLRVVAIEYYSLLDGKLIRRFNLPTPILVPEAGGVGSLVWYHFAHESGPYGLVMLYHQKRTGTVFAAVEHKAYDETFTIPYSSSAVPSAYTLDVGENGEIGALAKYIRVRSDGADTRTVMIHGGRNNPDLPYSYTDEALTLNGTTWVYTTYQYYAVDESIQVTTVSGARTVEVEWANPGQGLVPLGSIGPGKRGLYYCSWQPGLAAHNTFGQDAVEVVVWEAARNTEITRYAHIVDGVPATLLGPAMQLGLARGPDALYAIRKLWNEWNDEHIDAGEGFKQSGSSQLERYGSNGSYTLVKSGLWSVSVPAPVGMTYWDFGDGTGDMWGGDIGFGSIQRLREWSGVYGNEKEQHFKWYDWQGNEIAGVLLNTTEPPDYVVIAGRAAIGGNLTPGRPLEIVAMFSNPYPPYGGQQIIVVRGEKDGGLQVFAPPSPPVFGTDEGDFVPSVIEGQVLYHITSETFDWQLTNLYSFTYRVLNGRPGGVPVWKVQHWRAKKL